MTPVDLELTVVRKGDMDFLTLQLDDIAPFESIPPVCCSPQCAILDGMKE